MNDPDLDDGGVSLDELQCRYFSTMHDVYCTCMEQYRNRCNSGWVLAMLYCRVLILVTAYLHSFPRILDGILDCRMDVLAEPCNAEAWERTYTTKLLQYSSEYYDCNDGDR